ncbi:hypothetical protein BD779DRAFT_1515313 [Infundibulicybe gibba]|nr:hypothetical protein BD779DRAFT_1515313 [Infundibulicybe gibba]
MWRRILPMVPCVVCRHLGRGCNLGLMNLTVHLVGFPLLSRVLESPGGPCDQLQAKSSDVTDREVFGNITKEFKDLVLQINDASNVLFVEVALESMVYSYSFLSSLVINMLPEISYRHGFT